MTEAEPYCKHCRFFDYDNDECRHRSPRQTGSILDCHFAELLRDIAWSLLKLSGRTAQEAGEIHEENVLQLEAYEAAADYGRPIWPVVDKGDWCGDYQTADLETIELRDDADREIEASRERRKAAAAPPEPEGEAAP